MTARGSESRRTVTDPRVAMAELRAQLRQARKDQGITQAGVGAALGLGAPSIANWELGRIPSAGNFVLWAEALDLAFVIVDEAGRRYRPRPVPRGGEPVEMYRLRCLAIVLRDRRLEADLTQEAVGERLGVSPWTVQMWENSRRVPRVKTLIAWCHALDCRLALATL